MVPAGDRHEVSILHRARVATGGDTPSWVRLPAAALSRSPLLGLALTLALPAPGRG